MAVSQRYEELHPGIRILWDKRTLDEFGHKPVDQLIKDYDLIVIDHPWAGFCFANDLTLDLNDLLSDEQMNDLAQNCVGQSFNSYLYEHKLLAVPIDVATPAPSWRPDLIEQNGISLPATWDDLILLADRKLAIMPGHGPDLFLNWLMLLHALDAHPFETPDHPAQRDMGMTSMSMLKRLAEPMPEGIFNWNPILIAELMTQSDQYAYCAFAYSYNNYCRSSFTDKPLKYGNLITLNNKPLRSILGGTGISISTCCKDIELALDFSLYCAGAQIQSGIYTYSGGQPARREAWRSQDLTSFTGGFLSDSYSAHENTIVRPRYNGYVSLQEKAGTPLQQFIRGEISIDKAWNIIEEYYRKSRMSAS